MPFSQFDLLTRELIPKFRGSQRSRKKVKILFESHKRSQIIRKLRVRGKQKKSEEVRELEDEEINATLKFARRDYCFWLLHKGVVCIEN